MKWICDMAKEASIWFETRTRQSQDDKFVALRDGAPQWVKDLVRSAHGDMFPDDWRYEAISHVLSRLEDADNEEDGYDDFDSFEIVDGLCDVYTAQLTAWLATNIARVEYVAQAVDEFGADSSDVPKLLSMGQFMEYREIVYEVIRALKERAEEEDNDEEDDEAGEEAGEERSEE